MNAINALDAIRARINGEWDNPNLMELGPLANTSRDILRIIELTEKVPYPPYGVSRSQEAWVKMPCGVVMAFENHDTNAGGTSYVRFLDEKGGEIAYWNRDEWVEEPELVMGAICGAMMTCEEADPEKFYRFADDCEFPEGVNIK